MNDRDLQKALEQDAQLISERIPMNVTKAKAEEMARTLQAFMAERGLKQAAVAKMLGLGITRLNQFLNNKYEHNLEELVNKCKHLMDSIVRKERRVKGKSYVETTIARQIATLIIQTEACSDSEGKIGLIIGDAGHGKSHCMQQYIQANKNTIYVQLDEAMTSTTLFAEIAAKLDIDFSGFLTSITRRLIDNLKYRNIIILLDEASSLSVKQLNQLRQIIVVKAKCPLILAGNRHLLKTITQSATKRGFESLDQFRSRLMYILDLDKIASDKNGGLYTAEDIRKLYTYGGLRLTSDGVNVLRSISKTSQSGRLRTCSHIIALLHTSRKIIKTGIIDGRAIVSAIEQLDLPIKVHLPVALGEPQAEEAKEKSKAAKAG